MSSIKIFFCPKPISYLLETHISKIMKPLILDKGRITWYCGSYLKPILFSGLVPFRVQPITYRFKRVFKY